ncbi:MAG: hypothetical protein ABSF21_05435 [Dehalococcoidia bacterium]
MTQSELLKRSTKAKAGHYIQVIIAYLARLELILVGKSQSSVLLCL